MTQYELIKRHLEDHGSITTWDSFTEYGITRLSQYIMILRREGLMIESVNTTKKNRYGKDVTFSTYKLQREPQLNLF